MLNRRSSCYITHLLTTEDRLLNGTGLLAHVEWMGREKQFVCGAEQLTSVLLHWNTIATSTSRINFLQVRSSRKTALRHWQLCAAKKRLLIDFGDHVFAYMIAAASSLHALSRTSICDLQQRSCLRCRKQRSVRQTQLYCVCCQSK